ncbi:MAG: SDR family NAD(P)-dependent oxidoreductase, partial [Rickettsiales bacterium]|nr:SDR family NAD(P)-dependent oxidoreductase [Rickettsiales bacterium]
MTKTILITGASAGIGKATAELLASEGHRLILTGRRAGKLAELAATLECDVHILTFDVRDREASLAAIRSLPDAWKEIDVLVNNAGLALGLSSFEEADYADWQVMIETNLMGVLSMTREILPAMRAR